MVDTSEFIGLATLICTIIILFNIILFFKIWFMTNDISKIKNILQEWLDIEHPETENEYEKPKIN